MLFLFYHFDGRKEKVGLESIIAILSIANLHLTGEAWSPLSLISSDRNHEHSHHS